MAQTGTPKYRAAVKRLRDLQRNAHDVLVQLYEELCEIRRTKLWKEGPYQSFERFMYEEIGWAAQKFANFELAVKRFGPELIRNCGWEVACTMLRVPENSLAEKQVLGRIEEMTQKRGGRAPSAEAVERVIRQEIPPQRPVGYRPTEADRLREEVRRLQEEVRRLKHELAQEKSARKATEAKLRRRKNGGDDAHVS